MRSSFIQPRNTSVVLQCALIGVFAWCLASSAAYGAGAASLSSAGYVGGPWSGSAFPNKTTGFAGFNAVGSTVSLGQNLYGNSVFDLSSGSLFSIFAAGTDGDTYLENQTFSLDLYGTDPSSSLSIDNYGCQLSYDGNGDNLSLKVLGQNTTSTVSTSVTDNDLNQGIHIALTMNQGGQFTFVVSSISQEANPIYSDSGVMGLSEQEGGGSMSIETSSALQFDNLNISSSPISSGVAPVPEPSTMAMMAAAAGLLALAPLRKHLRRA